MDKITSPALVFPNMEYGNLNQQKEEAKLAFEQIKNGQERLENALTALGILGEASIMNTQEMPALGTPETSDEFHIRIEENIENAKDLYTSRLVNGITLQSRASSFTNLSGEMPSETRYRQLLTLSDEQIAAIDDSTLKSILDKNTEDEIKEIQWLKTLTPEEIIIIQEMPMGRRILETILEGKFDSPDSLEKLQDALYKGIEKYSK